MTLFLSLLNNFLPSLGLIAVAWLLMRTLRLNAATRYAAWWGVLAVIIVLPFLPADTRIPAKPVVVLSSQTAKEVQPVTTPPAARVAADEAADEHVTPTAPSHTNESDMEEFMTIAYVLIAVLLVARLSVDYLRVRRLVRTAQNSQWDCSALASSLGIRRKVQILTSEAIETPLAVGFRRPSILLPASLIGKLSDGETEHVVIHELAHIARRDDWTNLIGKLLQALCWVHPLVALVLRQIEAEREHACDDWVVSATGGVPNSYARSLARLVELALAKRHPLLSATVIGQGPKVSERVEMLFDRTRNFTPRIALVKFGMSLVCLALLAVVCTQAPALVARGNESNHFDLSDEGEQDQPPVAPSPKRAPRPLAAPRAASVPPVGPPAPDAVPAPAPAPVPEHSPNAKPGLLAALSAAGYKDLPVETIIQMKDHGVDGNYILQMAETGWGKLSPRQLIELRNHGVNGDYLRELKAAGIRDVSVEEAIELRNHGLRPNTITEIHAMGFGPYDKREVIEMANNGVRPQFFQSLKQYGISRISAREAIEAARHGLNGKSMDEARKYGPNLSFEQMLKLKRAGVI
jgi:beta-lactamase regulating signal transducer with metallopeptidase domain